MNCTVFCRTLPTLFVVLLPTLIHTSVNCSTKFTINARLKSTATSQSHSCQSPSFSCTSLPMKHHHVHTIWQHNKPRRVTQTLPTQPSFIMTSSDNSFSAFSGFADEESSLSTKLPPFTPVASPKPTISFSVSRAFNSKPKMNRDVALQGIIGICVFPDL